MTNPMEARTAPKTSGYRRDLDGLRGIAIAFVVIFHVFVNRVSGGVDVFLLLSGFFFLGSQLRNAERPGQSINPWWSIWRTVRRLLPSLLLVVGAVLLAYAALPAFRSLDLVRQIPASVLYYQNWMLIDQNQDYNAASADVSPLQHLWSMSVQGQFYLGAILLISFIALLIRTTKARPGAIRTIMLVILAAITSASFLYAIHLHETNQALNYYSTFSRLWELTLGGVLALAISRIRIPQWVPRGVLTAVGLLMILSTGFIIDGSVFFPGPATLWPLIGAALVIVAGGGSDLTSRLLSSRPMVWLGDIAYSLYLWHWPILIVTMFVLNRYQVGIRLGVSVIAISVILAWLTHRFVEKPLSQRSRRPTVDSSPVADALAGLRTSGPARARAAAAIALSILMLVCTFADTQRYSALETARYTDLDPEIYPGALAVTEGRAVPEGVAPQPSTEFATRMLPETAYDGCIALDTEDPTYIEDRKHLRPGEGVQPDMCFYGDTDSDKTIVMVGGSHSEQWFVPLDTIAREQGYRLFVMLRQGCPATLSPVLGVNENCDTWGHAAAEYIEDMDPDMVVTTGTRQGMDRTDYTPDGYIEFWDRMLQNDIAVTTIRDNPWPYDDEGQLFDPMTCYARTKDIEACGVERDWVMSPIDDAARVLDGVPNTLTIDFTDALCPDGFCPPVLGNIYTWRDDNHLTDMLARTLTNEMRAQLAPFLEDLANRQDG